MPTTGENLHFEKYRDIWDRLSSAVAIIGDDGSLLYKNTSMIRLLQGMDIAETQISVCTLFEGEGSQGFAKFKNIRFEVFRTAVVIDENPATLYIFEHPIRLSQELRDILDCIDDIIILASGDGIYELGNVAIKHILDYEPSQLIGMSTQDLITQNFTNNPIAHEVMLSKKVEQRIVEYSNGKSIMFTGIPLLNEEGEISRIVLTGRDVSNLVHLENELKRAEEFKIKYYQQSEELQKYREMYEIVCSSEKMESLLNLAVRVAKTDSSVFITGESGVGKEEIAKFIHRNSKRKNKPFIAINCAAIPSELLESEFFGYEEGAFTGAKKGGMKGLFEEANNGTIFLDEIGELPIKMQSKLLRVIQENGIMRIGGKKLIPVDVRYICATNLSKEELSDNLKFRQDLYYRLSVVPIRVPALRERKDDIIPLVHHFLKCFNEKYGFDVKISKSVIQRLYNYEWRGNVREMKNAIERLVILAEGDLVDDDAFETVLRMNQEAMDGEERNEIQISRMMGLNEAYRMVDEILIKKALQEHGTVVKAADALGIDPSTIHRKIKKGYKFT